MMKSILTFTEVIKRHQNTMRDFYYKLQSYQHIFLVLIFITSYPTLIYANPKPKVVHAYFVASEIGFDPIATSDLYSSKVDHSIFETLYDYDYLARPSKIIPHTALALPQISSDGLTYTIAIKKGIYFSDDPVFKNQKRELTSYDYAYSLKRLLDPKLNSPNQWLFAGKFKGLDQLVQQAKIKGQFDYDAAVDGIQTPDRYTLILKLNKADYNLPMLLAHTPTAAVAREVIEKYKNPQGFAMDHPIGTGPYRLVKWTPGSRIILEKNPNYRGFIWDFKANPNDPRDAQIVAQMKGKKMPQVDVVDIQVLEDPQTRWLSFKQKQLDWLEIGGAYVSMLIKNNQLIPELQSQGIHHLRDPYPAISYAFFNMQDPVVGGHSTENLALRRAISMAFSYDQYNEILADGNIKASPFPVAPGMVGYDPTFKSSTPHSIAAANALLDQFNYKKDKTGYRTRPNGDALSIEYSSSASMGKQSDALFWKKTLDQIGIRFKPVTMQFPEYLKKQKRCKVQMGMQSWIADYPDADNFFQLFYGNNIYSSNFACFKDPQFDQYYDASLKLPQGPERQLLYAKMARILQTNSVVIASISSYDNILVHPHVLGFKQHPMIHTPWIYIDIQQTVK